MRNKDVLNHLIQTFDLKSYLEIGVRDCSTFEKVICQEKFAVDPAPQKKISGEIAHAEWDNDKIKNRERLNSVIEKGEDLFGRPDKPRQIYIEIDDSFPRHVIENQEKFSHMIKRI